ncbi:DUF3784 domain-containing protein [Echinicola soli]|uniref:DUF3784 domain-containing protein n=1 Tax=Echinicola soli TaxID=2591634 RepID=A0A514CKG3_9BACT|nr:DUF3784 domain-containing protein [Echinicola soli]
MPWPRSHGIFFCFYWTNMIFVVFAISLLFISIGYLVNKGNAAQLLSGYNRLSEEERKKIDITSYLELFRRFHWFLGIGIFIGSGVLYFSLGEQWTAFFMTSFTMVAYCFFIWYGLRFYKGVNVRSTKIALMIFIILTVFTTGFFIYLLAKYPL